MNILCCGFFSALQRTLDFSELRVGQVNRARGVLRSVGGKAANSARVLKTLGVDPLLLGFAGGYTGRAVRDLLDDEGIAHRFIETEVETRICQTILADCTDDFTELIEDSPPLPVTDWDTLLKAFAEVESGFDRIILSGTLRSNAPADIYAKLIAATDSSKVILDTVGAPLLATLEHSPALVKINAEELRISLGKDGKTEDLAGELIDHGARAVGITDGAEKAMLVTPDAVEEFRVPKVKVVSTLGCGDSVNAGIAFALSEGRSLKEAFVFGLECGSANAQTSMPGVIKGGAKLSERA